MRANTAESDNVTTVSCETVGGVPEPAQDGRLCARSHGNVRAEHWARQPSIVTQFWQHVRKSDGCWAYEGTRNRHRGGYGIVRLGGSGTRTALTWYAHRFSYELHYGRIPDGQVVCHRCDNPSCVRPDHLFLGSQRDNMRDASRKGRLRVARPRRRKVTDRAVEAIRHLRRHGASLTTIAATFGVSVAFVSLVLAGKRRAVTLPMPERRYASPGAPLTHHSHEV